VNVMGAYDAAKSGSAHVDAHQTEESPRRESEVSNVGASAVEFAAYVMAARADGIAERILRQHYPTSNGLCAGCLASPTNHPCQVARIALLARQRPEYREAAVELGRLDAEICSTPTVSSAAMEYAMSYSRGSADDPPQSVVPLGESYDPGALPHAIRAAEGFAHGNSG